MTCSSMGTLMFPAAAAVNGCMLPPNETVFGDRACEEIIRVKQSHGVGP